VVAQGNKNGTTSSPEEIEGVNKLKTLNSVVFPEAHHCPKAFLEAITEPLNPWKHWSTAHSQ